MRSPIRYGEAFLRLLPVVEGTADPSTARPTARRGTAGQVGLRSPNFLWNLVALMDLMRLSLREWRTRNLDHRCVAGNPGRDDKGWGGVSNWDRLPIVDSGEFPVDVQETTLYT